MKKVIIFYPHIGEYGGIERNIIALAKEIKHRGLQPILLCYYDRINLSNYAGFDIETVFIEDHWNPIAKSYRLKKWFKKNAESITGNAFVFGTKAGFYAGLGFLSDYALHYTDPPSLLSQKKKHGFNYYFSSIRAKLSNAIIQLGVNRAQNCITMTELNAIELEAIYMRPFEVIHQGGVPARGKVTVVNKCVNKKLVLFSICRISTSKNLDWIILSVKELLDNEEFSKLFTDIEIIIAGKGPDLRRLEQLTVENKLQSIVSFPGFLNDDQLEENYGKSDLFLVPGRQGYGLPILEALYRELPVVINVESRVSEILGNNPWVAISENSNGSFTEHILSHIQNLKKEYPANIMLNDLPTESKWATSIGILCGWWVNKI
jgi:glycosyltransferase involved in cell wall biosynthesis